MASSVFASGEVREILIRRTGKRHRVKKVDIFDYMRIKFQKLDPPSEEITNTNVFFKLYHLKTFVAEALSLMEWV